MEHIQNKVYIERCPICEKTDFKHFLSTKDYFLTQEKFELVQCTTCDFVFTNPIPQLANLTDYYNSPNYLSHAVSKKSIVGSLYNVLRNQNLKNKYRLISGYKTSGNILDIGQGTGEFLNFMNRNGWDTTGIEPNESAQKFAFDQYKLKVYPEEYLKELEPNSFDIISLWHVMEHVPSLNQRMDQIRSLIAKNGILIIAVPNLNAPDYLKYGEKWAALDVPRHLYHFTKDSMTRLLDKFDFKVENSYPMKMDAYYVSLLSERYLKNRFPYPAAFLAGLRSNMAAKKENNYSSMIFVAKQK